VDVMTEAVGDEAPGRTVRRFTAEQRAQMVAESYTAGVTISAVARRHGIRPTLLSYWRAIAGTTGKRASRAATLAAVRVSAPSARDGVIEIDLANGCVRVRGSVDGAMLREVLAATR
jgi:transposase